MDCSEQYKAKAEARVREIVQGNIKQKQKKENNSQMQNDQ